MGIVEYQMSKYFFFSFLLNNYVFILLENSQDILGVDSPWWGIFLSFSCFTYNFLGFRGRASMLGVLVDYLIAIGELNL